MAERFRRWISKTTPETVAERLKQTRQLGVEKQGTWQPQLHELNMRVKGLLNELGIPAQYHHYYISAAQEFWKLRLQGAQGPLNVQADGIAAGWKTRGLEFSVLQAVAGLLGYSPRAMMLESDCPGGAALCDLNPQDVGSAPSPGVSDLASRCDHVHRGATAYNVFKICGAYNRIIQGGWSYGVSALQFMNGWFTNGSNAIGDELEYKFSQKAGTFTFCLLMDIGPWFALMSIYVDGVFQGTIDAFDPNQVFNTVRTLSIAILADGEHTLNIRVTATNGSSNTVPITAWWLRD